MLQFVLRRLAQAVLTVLGIMLLTFVLFRVVAGDVSANYVNPKLGKQAKETWMHKHGLDKPWIADTRFSPWQRKFYDSQFFGHLRNSVTFENRSYGTDEKLTDIIQQKARYSLAITVPGMALGWLSALGISCLVAYYRGRLIDKGVVFLAVLGMCVPYLAYMIGGQWIMFQVHPPAAWGLANKYNIFLPVAIGLVAGLGSGVRFYRTIILDEIHRDYVRTARAKGVPLPTILFKHVLKNCMLPILTQLILAIPFLIMGALLLEQFFGIPGLGGLLLASISAGDVPIISGLVFLTAVVDVLALLLTDVLYAVFDPRIRLQ